MNKTAAIIADRQPARERNIDAIVAYFESGIKKSDMLGELGIELEHIILHDDLSPVCYSGQDGIERILGALQPNYSQITRDSEGDLLGMARPGEAITLEPAAQLELSAGPFKRLDDAFSTFSSFEDTLGNVLSPFGERACAIGYHPTATASSLELIPKRRYRFMDLYLNEKGEFGRCMMRGSASTQVSIDYTSTQDCLRKLRLAFALVPPFSLMCDNAPIFEGKPRAHKLIRTEIWRRCDPSRCGLVPGVMEHDFDLRRYAEYILDTPAILAPCVKERWCYTERTFGDIYAEQTMTHTEIEHAVSMFFNDVRLKTYLEIRPADALPIPYAISYAALIKGLFYNPSNLDELDALFDGVKENDIEVAKDALMEHGYAASIYGRPIAELCDRLIDLGYRGLDPEECRYLDPLADLVTRRTTLADEKETDYCGII